jgi:hypothetical protein
VSGQETGTIDLQVVATPDADADGLARDLAGLGGVLRNRADGLNGATLRVRLPAAMLRAVLERDDVVWLERSFVPRLANDRARSILGVTAAGQQLSWLDGTGQIIAVTDTGLDVQSTVETNGNPDFAADRIAGAFTPQQMSSLCSGKLGSTSWSDRNGHGTHVAGSALGGGRPPVAPSLAGVAPRARLVVQSVSSGGDELDCLSLDATFLDQAYGAGARIQNASWGQPTGQTGFSFTYGGYTAFEQTIDGYLWNHKDHLFVAVAGNQGADIQPRNGVTDPDSINSPGTAKNVLTVGATENNRPPGGSTCVTFGSGKPPENQCYGSFGAAPIATDHVSDRSDGMAAFSSRGPTDDGRVKPEIVAPGTNIVSAASHTPGVFYPFGTYDANYAYDSGTSMSAPLISGMAALVRQWLIQGRQVPAPSAALVKALLLNGAKDIGPGQYGTGGQREIPAAWPNNVEGWGRATLTDTIGLASQDIWFADDKAGLLPSAAATYTITVGAGEPLRISLAWTDYPASPIAGRALVNDLDLEVQPPAGSLLRGNAGAALPTDCRAGTGGADRCNNAESVEVAAPQAGTYVVRVRAASVPQGPQPFALAARASTIADVSVGIPTLQPIDGDGPALVLSWSAVPGAGSYQVEESASANFASIRRSFTASGTSLTILEDIGSYWFRVRACLPDRCGALSNVEAATVIKPPRRAFLPAAAN